MAIKNQEKFIELITKKEKAIEAGNAKIANINYDKISKIVEEWREDPEVDLRELEPLLEHEEDYVKYSTAFVLIPILPEKAENVLEALASKRGNVSFDARMLLQEWRKGNLKF